MLPTLKPIFCLALSPSTSRLTAHGSPLLTGQHPEPLAERLYADKSVKSLVQQDVMRSVQAKQGYVPSEKVSRGGSAVPGVCGTDAGRSPGRPSPIPTAWHPHIRGAPLLALRRMALKPW